MRNRISNLFVASLCLGLVGCEQATPTEKIELTPPVPPPTNVVETVTAPFTITSKGTFKAGYDKGEREIFILKDNATGEEYLGITDCTLIRRVKKKEEARNEAIETAVDIVGSIAEAAAGGD